MWLVTLFLAALAAQQATSQYTPDFIENVYDGSRIVSGWEAQPGQHPHQVSLRMVRADGAVQGCGGNIVHREWILTAAHCTATQVTILVRAGVTHMTRPEMVLETLEYYIYPSFIVTQPAQVQLNDISLVKLQQPLVYSNNLRPIRIQPSADAFKDYSNDVLYASGFGRTWTDGPQPQTLMWVYLLGISNTACTNIFSSRFVSQNTICARFYNVTSQSICQGDSGGPLVYTSPEGERILVGISSFVAGNPHGCHSGLPGAFVRPGPFHSWFTEITGIDFNNLREEEETTTTPPTTTSTTTTTTTTPSTTTPSTTTPSTTTYSTTTLSTTTSSTTTPTTTTAGPIPTPNPPTSTSTSAPITTSSPETDPEEELDPELEKILKKLEIQVKVLVRLSKYAKKDNDSVVTVE